MGKVHPSSHPIAWVGLLLSYKLVSGAQINQTIDDTFGDSNTGQLVTYTPTLNPPPSLWVDQTCQGCSILPSDPPEAFNGTFHGAAYNPSVPSQISFQLDFAGTAIYVFFTLVNNVNTFVNFTVDNTPAGFFTYYANTNSETLYQVPVFSHTNLQNSQHSLLASVTPSSAFSYVNFDYAIYTQDDGIPEPLPATLSPAPSFPLSSSAVLFTHTHRSWEHLRSKTRSLENIQSRVPPIFSQSSTLITALGSSAKSPTPIASSTPGPLNAARQTDSTHLAIVGAVLGSVFALAVVWLLVRSRRFRNRTELRKQRPAPFIEVKPEDPPLEDSAILVPQSKPKLYGNVSASLAERVRFLLRRTRQAEIEQRLRILRGEIVELSSKLSARGAMMPANGSQLTEDQQHATEAGDNSTSSERLRRMLSMKRHQLEHLEQQRHSPWALGLSRESPL